MGASTSPKKKKNPTDSKPKPGDGRLRIVLGLILLLIAFFAGLSFISYFFTWKADQSFLDTELTANLANPDIRVENWAGKAGAVTSNLFIYKWFGVSSVMLVALLALYGIALLGPRLVRLGRATKYGLILMIWISVMLGYAVPGEAFQFGGGHGVAISAWLSALIGPVGTLVTIVVTGLILVVFMFRVTPDRLKLHDRKPEEKLPEPEFVDPGDDFVV
ncbi:MAG TPA: hypothetical protein DC042_18355, partial [Bacteroidales bacterium]|nr:hypothetical protein [Bacteroidales bacterium]